MNFEKLNWQISSEKFLICIFLSLLFCCSKSGLDQYYSNSELHHTQSFQPPSQNYNYPPQDFRPQYPPQIYYPVPASRYYSNPYAFEQRRTQYYESDRYYYPPQRYYNNESEKEMEEEKAREKSASVSEESYD